MGIVILRRVWKGAVLLFLTAALIVGAIVGSGRAAAQPLATPVDVQPEEQTWVTTEFISTVNEMMRLFPAGPVEVHVTWRPELYGSYAGTAGNGIWFPPEFAVDPNRFTRNVGIDIANGFHPAGCSAARMVAIHEYGHVIDNYHGRQARYNLLVEFGSGLDLHGLLPKYAFNNPTGTLGALNPGEALASAFAAVQCGTATPQAQRISEILLTS